MTIALTSALVFTLFLLGISRYQIRLLEGMKAGRDEYRRILAEEHGSLQREHSEIHQVIATGPSGSAGVCKLISENHEIAQAIREHCPQLFQSEPGLVHWLHFNEQFLVTLRDVAMPQTYGDVLRKRFENFRPMDSEIYAEIKRDLGHETGEHG